jgi:hypothetical protein
VDLGGQLDLLYAAVRVEDRVLLGGPAEGQQPVLLGDGGFGVAIVPEVCRLLAGVQVVRGVLGMGMLGLLLLVLLLLLLLSRLEGPLQ